jgi:hypothetical protein
MVERIGDIVIGVHGIVRNGEPPGMHVLVEDDRRCSSGYLIRTSPPEDDVAKNGYRFDGWVASAEDLPQYFREAGWQVVWDDTEDNATQTI